MQIRFDKVRLRGEMDGRNGGRWQRRYIGRMEEGEWEGPQITNSVIKSVSRRRI
jgi:hypothetical protein